MNFFNPKLKDMIKENPDQSVIGFAWALTWRLQLAIFGIYLIVIIGLIFLGVLFS